MTKYILHGGGVDPKTGNNDSFYTELMADVSEGDVVLLVYFASRATDDSDNIANITALCRQLAPSKNLTLEIATETEFEEQAKRADVVYFRGGSTEKLIETLKQFPDLKSLLENKDKTVAGLSAGAYALSTLYPSHYASEVMSGFGVVPLRVVTHWQSETMSSQTGSVEMLQNTQTDLSLVILREGEWCAVRQ